LPRIFDGEKGRPQKRLLGGVPKPPKGDAARLELAVLENQQSSNPSTSVDHGQRNRHDWADALKT